MRFFPDPAGLTSKGNTVINISQGRTISKLNLESAIISSFSRYFECGSGGKGQEAGKLESSLMDAQTRYFQQKIRFAPTFQK
jgi:hypothetical protein